jgi:hypothetical protein
MLMEIYTVLVARFWQADNPTALAVYPLTNKSYVKFVAPSWIKKLVVVFCPSPNYRHKEGGPS